MKSYSFEHLYKHYYPRLVAYASLFLRSDISHDIVQEVFLNLLEKNQKDLDEKALNAYLYKAVHNKCVDFIRHQITKDQYSSKAGEVLLQKESEYYYANRNEIEDAIISEELQQQIESAIEVLPPKGREVFKFYFEEQKSAKEISNLSGISISTVNNHIYNCLKIIRKKLSNYVITLLALITNFIQ